MSSQRAYEIDDRHTDPNENRHRCARFRDGWQNALNDKDYTAETLTTLTWENLGYRLGFLFRDTSPQLIEQMYDWRVKQQAESKSETN